MFSVGCQGKMLLKVPELEVPSIVYREPGLKIAWYQNGIFLLTIPGDVLSMECKQVMVTCGLSKRGLSDDYGFSCV